MKLKAINICEGEPPKLVTLFYFLSIGVFLYKIISEKLAS